MMETLFDYKGEISWCPGCGDYKILSSIKEALTELGKRPEEVAMVSGIGQAAKMPHYVHCHCFNCLHGRALPAATGIHASNPNLTVIAVGGDGDMYGEGGNHFLHTIRRNPNITHLVCNNMIYGLTKGQASPTTPQGMKTPTQPNGSAPRPMNPLAVALAQGASFVARGSAAEPELTKNLIKAAILHEGYALIDIFQPCVSFNKINTWQWLQAQTYKLDENQNCEDPLKAMALANECDPYPLGIFYQEKNRPHFIQTQAAWQNDPRPLFEREAPKEAVKDFINRLR